MGTNKVITTTRKAYCQKGTIYVAIPKKFVERHNIQPGDDLVIVADDTMRVIPRERWAGLGQPEVSGRYLTINGEVMPLED